MFVSTAFLKQLWLTLGASLAFLVIGLVRGYSSSALPSMEALDPGLVANTQQKSWIGAGPPLGAFLGSTVSGALMARCGRRRTLQLAAPLWAGCWLLLAAARSFPLLIVARVGSGVCVGLVLATVQVYVSECCDPATRGRLSSLPTLAMSLGILVSYVAGTWLPWRHLAYLSASFCGALFVALLPLPESPVWLAARGADPAAALRWLHLPPKVVEPLKDQPQDKVELAAAAAAAAAGEQRLFTRGVLLSRGVLRPLGVGLALLALQQLSGIDAVIFFTVEIFQTAGSSLDPMTATIVVGAVQLAANAVSTALVDRAGRRPLLAASAAVMAAAMAAMGTAFYFQLENDSWLGYLPVASLVVFMVGFSLGFGGVPFVLLGELFPARHRSQLSALAGAANLLAMFAVIKTYHSLDALLTSAGTFWLYAGCCALALAFVLLAVPETKGKSLADIERHFRAPPPAPAPAPVALGPLPAPAAPGNVVVHM